MHICQQWSCNRWW